MLASLCTNNEAMVRGFTVTQNPAPTTPWFYNLGLISLILHFVICEVENTFSLCHLMSISFARHHVLYKYNLYSLPLPREVGITVVFDR